MKRIVAKSVGICQSVTARIIVAARGIGNFAGESQPARTGLPPPCDPHYNHEPVKIAARAGTSGERRAGSPLKSNLDPVPGRGPANVFAFVECSSEASSRQVIPTAPLIL
jgi:hypothetical protein